MPTLKYKEVLSFSSEDPNHPAENLLRPDTFRKWKCAAGSSEKQAFVILKLERLSSILSVDIGNEGSAFVEVLVAREGGDFQVLLVASSFMTPSESRIGSNLSRVRMFGSEKLNKTVAEQKWDRLKVICTQPFNKSTQYGLSFITVTATSEGTSVSTPKAIKLGSFTLKDEEENDPISVGSVFARRKEAETPSPLTGAAAIRAASTIAAASISASPVLESKKRPSNTPDVGFYQLKKTTTQEKESPKTSHSSKHTETSPESTPNIKHSDKIKNREEKKHKYEDKRGETQKKRDHDEKEEKNKNKHRKDKNHDKSNRVDSEKKKGDSKTSHNKRSQDDDRQTTSLADASSNKKSAPFSALMKNVNFVLSGYQNPQRSQIRDIMIEMGGRYKSDWDPSCTHLICAFANTPKFQQVRGKGRIVTAKWTFDCHKNKIRYPTKRYALDKQRNSDDSEEEIWADELLPKKEKPSQKIVKADPRKAASDDEENYSDATYSDKENTDDEIERMLDKKKLKEVSPDKDENSSKSKDTEDETPPKKKRKHEEPEEKGIVTVQNINRKSNGMEGIKKDLNGTDDNIYDDDTDIDEENKVHLIRPDTSSLQLPSLGDYFNGKHFFIYGNMAADMKKLVSRYVIAFDGKLEDYMTDKVNFVVTESEWDDNFDEALSENPSIQFVKPAWIWRCSDKQKLVPFQPHMVVPKE